MPVLGKPQFFDVNLRFSNRRSIAASRHWFAPWPILVAIGGCSLTPVEHCGTFIPEGHKLVEPAPNLRHSLLEDLGNPDFPVDGRTGRIEAWFGDGETLIVCTYNPGNDTCDNKAAALTFMKGPDGWTASGVHEISTCASP
jgi:hypothetical protein